MKIIKEKVNNSIDLNRYIDKSNEDILFFDIETTGFDRDNTNIYMIGYIYFEDGYWYVEQHLAQSLEEEKLILHKFTLLADEKNTIISFNGDSFDIPYVTHKLLKYNLGLPFNNLESIDIYKKIKAYKKILGLQNCKLKTVEKLVGIHREDKYNGGQLIEQYYSYLKNKNTSLENNLLLHNKEDMIALLDLMKIYNILNGIEKISHYSYVNYKLEDEYLTIKLRWDYTFEFNISLVLRDISIELSDLIYIKIPLTKKELKYFFSDYKNYYYLTDRDEAIHKSIANFLPSDKKSKAKASNCYVRKTGIFIPVFDQDSFECFREDYKEKNNFTILGEILDTEFLLKYCDHIIKSIYNLKG